MRTHAFRLLLAVVAAAVAVPLVANAVDAQEGTSAAPDRGSASIGESLQISGSGWTPAARVQVSVCGNDALRGSADCDLPSSRTISANPDGTFLVTVEVVEPPAPCPCVVFVTGEQNTETVRFPVEIIGAASAPGTEAYDLQNTPGFDVEASVEGSGPWGAWFGGPAKRDLVLTITNTTPFERTPRLSVTWGTGPSPTHVVDVPTLEAIAAGSTAEFVIPVETDAFTLGKIQIAAAVTGAGPATTVTDSTSTYPWALIVLGLVALQWVLLRIRDRIRNRLHEDPESQTSGEPGGGIDPDDLAAALALQSGPTPIGELGSGDSDSVVPEPGTGSEEPEPEVVALVNSVHCVEVIDSRREEFTTMPDVSSEVERIRDDAEVQIQSLLARAEAARDQADATLADACTSARDVLESALAQAAEIRLRLREVDRALGGRANRLRGELDVICFGAEHSIEELRRQVEAAATATDANADADIPSWPVVFEPVVFAGSNPEPALNASNDELESAILRAVQKSLT